MPMSPRSASPRRAIAALTGESTGAVKTSDRPNVTVCRGAPDAESVERGVAVAEAIARHLDALDSTDRAAALHFDLARFWAQAAGR